MTRSIIALTVCIFASFVLRISSVWAVEPSVATYTCYPIFQVSAVAPNIVILLDNGAEMEQIVWHAGYDNSSDYTPSVSPENDVVELGIAVGNGFFNDNGYGIVKHGSGYYLVPVLDNLALGSYTAGLQADSGTTWIINGKSVTLPAVPSASVDAEGIKDNATNFRYSKSYLNWIFFSGDYAGDGSDLPDKSRFYYAKKAIFTVTKLASNKARFGIFNFTATAEGASNVQPLKGDVVTILAADPENNVLDSNFVNTVNNMGTVTYSPLAEGLAQVGGYYASPSSGAVEYVCQDSFVIVVSPGLSSEDQGVSGPSYEPQNFLDADDGDKVADGGIGEGNIKADPSIPISPIPTNQNGSTQLDDVAHYLHTNDIASEGGYVSTYTIGFMGNELSNLFLTNTSNNGNGNVNLYDTADPEYGKYHFEAEDPDQLAGAILLAVTDILARASSGTALSVLSTSGEGEGIIIQAYFRPTVPSGATEVTWVGYLQSLWVDPYGNQREDSDQDRALNVETDKVIRYFLDPATGDTKIKRFNVSAAAPYPDVESDPYEELELNQVIPLWEAGSRLHPRISSDRTIFTYLDKDGDGVVDESTDNPFDSSGEVVSFDTGSAAHVKPYLGVQNDATWSYLGVSHDERITNLIDYIRGADISGLRPRSINGNVWKLGDIVNSTPVIISKPPDNFHVMYGDESYKTYYNEFKNREAVVYVGANDGMLHAFTSWEYDSVNKQYTKPSTAPSTEQIGDELWAYVPQSLLAHLKWLPSSDYTHVYYVDLKPKAFDAKILPDDTHYADADSDDNWGTILLVGLNMGGQHIWAEGDYDDGLGTIVSETRHFYPSYTCIDVTDPRNPRLLWERTYTDLESTTSFPVVAKVKDKWFAVFGSGPENCDGMSSKNGHIFVVDLKTGDSYPNASFPVGTTDGWLFETSESNAFMGSPVAFDRNLNYNVDAIYFGESYYDGSWKGKLYKVTIPWADANGDYDGFDLAKYSDNPLDATNPWQLSTFFDAPGPITAPIVLSRDASNNVYLYVGSGRYISEQDKLDIDTQYLFGMKDPFFNSDPERSVYYHSYSSQLTLGINNLFDADPYVVTTTGLVFDNGTGLSRITDWATLLDVVRNTEDQGSYPDFYDGWSRTLTIPGERILTRPAILGGIVFTTSFVPNDDPCGFGGDGYLYGHYYETGTAYYNPVFIDQGTTTVTIDGQEVVQVLDKFALGEGKASAVSAHVGREEGAMGYIQQSTGAVATVKLKPAFSVKSGMRSWQQE
jgi:hypothetical protein